jgi:hypothetical protein
MPFLTKGKTNWKYILIVVILVLIVGGRILVWQLQEREFIEISTIKKPVTSKEFTLGSNEEARIIYESKEYVLYLFTIDSISKRTELTLIDLDTGLPCSDYNYPSLDGKIYLPLGKVFTCFWGEEGGPHFKLIDLKENKATFETWLSFAPPAGTGKPSPPRKIIIKPTTKIQRINITTDKTEYERGDTVKITIENTLEKDVVICDPFYNIRRFTEEKGWIGVASKGTWGPENYLILHSDETKEDEWTIPNQVPTGKYKIEFILGDTPNHCLRSGYSNEFMIKEKGEWKTYRSEKYKYEIKFPSNWQLNRGSLEEDFVEFSDVPTHLRTGEVLKKGWIDFAILIIPTEHTSFQEYLQELDKIREKEYERGPSVEILKEKSIKVSDLEAVQRQEFLIAAGFPAISTYFLKDGLAFHLEMKFAKSGPNFTIYEIQPEDSELNDQILSTFRFLE